MKVSYGGHVSWGLVIGAGLLTVGLLAVPPFHTTTHEYTTLVTGLMAAGLYWVSARRIQAQRARSNGSLDATGVVWGGVVTAVAAGLLSVGILFFANAYVFTVPCRVGTGLPYFAATYGPASLFSVLSGATAGCVAKGRRGLIAILLAFLILDGLHAAGQLYYGPRIFPVDLVLGDLAAFVQRGGVTVSAIHLFHGVALVALALVLGLALTWRVRALSGEPERALVARRRFLSAAFAVAVVLTFGGSYAGIGVGDRAVRDALPVSESTAHFDVRYSRNETTLSKIDAVTREAEWQWHRITTLWGFEPELRVRLFVFDSPESLARHTGIPYGHAGIREVYVTVDNALWTDILAHELVHAMHTALEPSPRILLSRGMLEGTATAFEDAFATMPEAHEMLAGAQQEGKIPPLEGIFSPFGFSANAEGGAYLIAGSFLGYLVYEYGMEPFIAYQQTLNFRRAYGARLIELEEEWREFLGGIPVRSDRRMVASQYFDLDENPSYLAIQCPKVGRRALRNEKAAREAYAREHFEDAATLYRALAQDTQSLEWYRWEAKAWMEAGQFDRAHEALDRAETALELKPFQQAGLVQDRIEASIRAGDWQRLNDAYATRRALDLGLGPGNERGEACLTNPALRERYAELFRTENVAVQRALWRALHRDFPDEEPLQFLYAAAGINPELPVETRAAVALAYLQRWPEGADDLAPTLRALYKDAIVERAYDTAGALAQALTTHCAIRMHRHWGEQGLARLAFEQSRNTGEHSPSGNE